MSRLPARVCSEGSLYDNVFHEVMYKGGGQMSRLPARVCSEGSLYTVEAIIDMVMMSMPFIMTWKPDFGREYG